MIEVIVPGIPVAKGRPRFARRGKFVSTYTPQKTESHEGVVAYCAQQAISEPLTGSLRLEVTSFHPIPASLSKAAKVAAASGERRPATRPDADNILKLVCDALIGIAYADDNQLVEIEARKFYALVPRTVIRVMPA